MKALPVNWDVQIRLRTLHHSGSMEMTEVHFSLLKPHGHEREKQDAVWLKQQQKTSQSCHKPPDKLLAHSLNKYANKCQKKEKKENHTSKQTQTDVLNVWGYGCFKWAGGAGASCSADCSENEGNEREPSMIFLHLRRDTSLRALHHWRQSQSLSEWSDFYTPFCPVVSYMLLQHQMNRNTVGKMQCRLKE